MPEDARDPTTPNVTVERLAKALNLAPERVEAAMRAAGVTPAEAFDAILHGSAAERVDKLAKELKVTRPRLALALLDGAVAQTSAWAGAAGGAVDAVRGRLDRAKDWFFDVLEFVLEIFAETIPRILKRITLVLVLTGLVMVGLGVLAVVNKALFLLVAYYAMAAAFLLFGLGLIWTAWRIHEMTSALRTLARLAKRWRERVNRVSGRGDD